MIKRESSEFEDRIKRSFESPFCREEVGMKLEIGIGFRGIELGILGLEDWKKGSCMYLVGREVGDVEASHLNHQCLPRQLEDVAQLFSRKNL